MTPQEFISQYLTLTTEDEKIKLIQQYYPDADELKAKWFIDVVAAKDIEEVKAISTSYIKAISKQIAEEAVKNAKTVTLLTYKQYKSKYHN